MIGQNIKMRREQAKLTQTQLGSLLDYDSSTIANIESNEQSLTIGEARQLAAILGCSLQDLVNGNPENRLKVSYQNLNLPKKLHKKSQNWIKLLWTLKKWKRWWSRFQERNQVNEANFLAYEMINQ